MQELSRDFDALGRNARIAKFARLDGQGNKSEYCEVFIDETCEDVKASARTRQLGDLSVPG